MVLLESSKLFVTLAPPELESVRKVACERKYASQQQIFREGDPGDGIYVVKEGSVQVSAMVGDERRVLSRITPGDIFGEMAVLDNDPRSATATAEDEVTLYFISREDLLQLLERIPRLSACLVREISRRLRDFNRHYIQEVLQAERLSLVGRFTRSIVHDLKNPLNVIGIAAELAGAENATLETRRAVKTRIRRQVDRIANMVNELLEFTRGAQNTVILTRTDFGLFVQQVIEELRPEVDLKSAKIELQSPPPNVRVDMNPPRLTRVFHNLAHNATDAMTGIGGGKILIRFKVTDKDVTTEIEDTGPGIAPEIAGRLFEAFATYGKVHGTGLGLSICKRIIEDHKGKIFTRSEPGHGAIFAFTLPLTAVPPAR